MMVLNSQSENQKPNWPNQSTEFQDFNLGFNGPKNDNELQFCLPPLKKFRLRYSVTVKDGCAKSQNDNIDDLQKALIQHQIFQNNYKPDTTVSLFGKIFPCSACSEVFYLKSGLESHYNREIVTIKLSCPHCGVDLTFFNRCLLLKHFQTHKVLPSVNSLKDCITFEAFNSCIRSYDYSLSQSKCSITMDLQHFIDPNQNQDNPEPATVPLIQNNCKPFICTICSEEFKDTIGLNEHVCIHHTNQILNNSVELTAITRGQGPPLDVKKRKQRMRTETKRLNVERIFPKSILQTLSKSEGKCNTTIKIGPKPEPMQCLPLTVAPVTIEFQKNSRTRLLDGTFKCLKCPDLPPLVSESVFLRHIKLDHVLKCQVDSDGEIAELSDDEFVHEEFWCPECGMVFIVKPSFFKHLLCAHDCIKNSEEYLNNIGYGVRPVKPLRENQCQVCRIKCEDTLDYQKHIRTHGMAFLRLRQQCVSN